MKHVITISDMPYFSTTAIYWATCSCGRFRSGKHYHRAQAEAAGKAHVKAKVNDHEE